MKSKSMILTGYAGILFIGDAHLNSIKPGRRIDDYTEAGLDKLSQCAKIAKERNLLPVCLGDLFHRPRENSLVLLSRLGKIMDEFHHPMLLLAGSHDRTESWFTEKDAGQLMEQMGKIQLIEQPGHVLSLDIGGKMVNLWATPAGCHIPDSIAADPAQDNIMITHHDLDFTGPYPGALELKEIENCGLQVNGHMHTQAPMVIRGRTACHNPGSIMRNTVDLRNQKPAVSVWTPAHGSSLETVPLVVADHVFDLTGKEAYAADPRDLKASLPKGLRLSSFATRFRAASSLEAARTEDGAVLIEEVGDYLTRFDKPDNLRRYLTGLLGEAVDARLATLPR